MKTPFTLFLSLLLSTTFFGQTPEAEGCDGIRYQQAPITNVETVTVKFGENIDLTGINKELYMDVYLPQNDDVEKRPAIIWGFGGAFVAGTRADLQEVCMEFARRGYVAVAFDYRLYSIFLGVPDSLTILTEVTMAIHDMRAAVRHLRLDAATTNQFKIDPDRIFGAGISAGGILALHLGYMDEDDAIPTYLVDILEDNGGFEGNSGDAQNLQYSSAVQAVVSLSGGLHKKEWMDADDPPLVSMHGTADEVVPYWHGITTAVLGGGISFPLVSMDGSGLIHQRADDLGIENYLVSVPDGGHEEIYLEPEFQAYRDDYTTNGILFLYDLLCPLTEPVFPVFTEDQLHSLSLEVFPNPATDQVWIEYSDPTVSYDVFVLDQMGRALQFAGTGKGSFALPRAGLAPGLYTVQLRFQDSSLPPLSRRIVFH